MRTVFVVNPKSGKQEGRSEFIKKIRETSEKTGIVCEVYVTKGVMDAERYVKEYIKERQGEKIRFISCGGDGTLNEVVNGAYRSSNVSVGVIPMGTGNDFVRIFLQ